MSKIDIDTWMLASDEEREDIHSQWDVENNEGKEVADEIAHLLRKECVYDVNDVSIIAVDGQWNIKATADSDYESLKDRDIVFLGFKLLIKKSTN